MNNSKIIEFILVILLLIAIFSVRSYKLDADPPVDLSASTDIYTDHPNLTLYGKQKVIMNDMTPSGDTRFPLFEKSVITIFAFLSFNYFGTGLLGSNVVGLFFSFSSLLVFFFIVRRIGGRLASIFYLLLIGLNYNQIFYGRLTFQEHAMAFFGFMSLLLILYSKNKFITVVAGMSVGVSILFCKLSGVIFLIPFFCYYLYNYFCAKNRKELIHVVLFSSGFTILTVVWFFYTYLPMQENVGAYVLEHVYAVSGFPSALLKPDKFIKNLVTFGADSFLFLRMKIGLIFCSIYLIMIFYKVVQVLRKKTDISILYNKHVLLASTIIGSYLFLMVWNYRPLRYQLVLIYPICAAAGIAMSILWNKLNNLNLEQLPKKFYLLFFPLIVIPIYNIYMEYTPLKDSEYGYEEGIYISLVIAIILIVLYHFYAQKISGKLLPYFKIGGKVMVVLALSVSLYLHWSQYYHWYVRPTFTIKDNSLDFSEILSPNAVVAGPYAATLTLETDYKTIIHMFGVSEHDPDFFKKYPITHILIDDDNGKIALKDYPEIMNKSADIVTYHIGDQEAKLVRVAGFTGNFDADSYQLSIFEKIVEQLDEGQGTINNQLIEKFLQKNPNNLTCYVLLAEYAFQKEQYKIAESMYKNALDFSPTNYILTKSIGDFYHSWFLKTDINEYKVNSLIYYEMADRIAPPVDISNQTSSL